MRRQHPWLSTQFIIRGRLILRRVFRVPSKELQDLFHTELADVLFGATFNGLVCELALLFLEFEDALFDGGDDGDFVDDDVFFLGEAVDTINGLFFNELFGIC